MIKKGQPQWKIEQRRLKERRGQGHGVDYQPYIKTYDFSSKGVRTRSLGWRSGRYHHFMSRDEYNYFLTLEFSDRIVDIREQFPLLPKERTIEIAKELNIPHPSDDNGDPVVMTTDFNITILGEQHPEDLRDVIRTVKPTIELNQSTLQKFEIERLFFEEKGTDWGIVIDEQQPANLISNLDWIYDSYYLSAKSDLNPDDVSYVTPYIFDAINSSEESFIHICLSFDKEFGYRPGSCLFIVKHMLTNKIWATDMYKDKLINQTNIQLHIVE